jgi:hypothetical protein
MVADLGGEIHRSSRLDLPAGPPRMALRGMGGDRGREAGTGADIAPVPQGARPETIRAGTGRARREQRSAPCPSLAASARTHPLPESTGPAAASRKAKA